MSLRQAITPERLQGRMNAAMRWIVWGTIPLGTLAGGAIATAYGLRAALWVGAIGGLFTFLPVTPLLRALDRPDALSRWTRRRRRHEAELEGGLVEASRYPAPLAADA